MPAGASSSPRAGSTFASIDRHRAIKCAPSTISSPIDALNRDSYFVTLETDAEKQSTIWGVDLKGRWRRVCGRAARDCLAACPSPSRPRSRLSSARRSTRARAVRRRRAPGEKTCPAASRCRWDRAEAGRGQGGFARHRSRADDKIDASSHVTAPGPGRQCADPRSKHAHNLSGGHQRLRCAVPVLPKGQFGASSSSLGTDTRRKFARCNGFVRILRLRGTDHLNMPRERLSGGRGALIQVSEGIVQRPGRLKGERTRRYWRANSGACQKESAVTEANGILVSV